MTDPENLILAQLREMRAEAARHSEMLRKRMSALEHSLNNLGKEQVWLREALRNQGESGTANWDAFDEHETRLDQMAARIEELSQRLEKVEHP